MEPLINRLIPHVADDTLKDLHESIAHIRQQDLANGLPPMPYGTSIYGDWKSEGDALEAEMTNRGIPYTPITW